MRRISKYVLGIMLAGGLFFAANAVASTLQGFQGGTGFASSTTSTVGQYLQVASTSPFLTFQFATPTSSGGGSISTSSATSTGYFPNWVGSGLLSVTSSIWQSSSTAYVGVNNINPSDYLDVTTAATQKGITMRGAVDNVALNFTNTGTGGHSYGFYSTAGGSGAGQGSFAIFDATASNYRLVVASSGNVGIGTTTPAFVLDVQSAAGTSNVSTIADFVNTSAGSNSGGQIRVRSANVNAAFGTDAADNAFGAGIFVNGTQQIHFSGGGIALGTYSNNNSITPTGGAIIPGNVSIGTSTAAVPLQLNFDGDSMRVGTGANTATKIGFAWGGSSYRGSFGYDGTGMAVTGGTAKALSLYSNAASSPSLVLSSAGPNVGIGGTITDISTLAGADVFVNGTTANVGIGTTAPSSTLTNTGSFAVGYRSVSTTTTLTATSSIVGITSTSTLNTITLPNTANVANGTMITIADEGGNAGTNPITIATATSTQKINGLATTTIATNNMSLSFYSTGSNWIIK